MVKAGCGDEVLRWRLCTGNIFEPRKKWGGIVLPLISNGEFTVYWYVVEGGASEVKIVLG